MKAKTYTRRRIVVEVVMDDDQFTDPREWPWEDILQARGVEQDGMSVHSVQCYEHGTLKIGTTND